MTVGDAAGSYETKTDANASLKPRSKAYYKMVLGFIDRSRPTLFETDVRKVSDGDCETWLLGFQKAYAPTVVNNGIPVLRAVFQEAIGADARFNNPAAGLNGGGTGSEPRSISSTRMAITRIKMLPPVKARPTADRTRRWMPPGCREERVAHRTFPHL